MGREPTGRADSGSLKSCLFTHNWLLDPELRGRKMSDETFDRKLITPAEREARKAFRQVDAKKAMTEHEIAEKAFSNNRERLKAERLARETAEQKANDK
jgi:hypothetical protein